MSMFLIRNKQQHNFVLCIPVQIMIQSTGTGTCLQYCYTVGLWVGRQEEHPACKNRVKKCWCGYLSGVRCRLFAHGPADATVYQNPIISCLFLNPDWFNLSGTSLPGCPGKRPLNRCSSSSSTGIGTCTWRLCTGTCVGTWTTDTGTSTGTWAPCTGTGTCLLSTAQDCLSTFLRPWACR